ncbi:MAG: TolC family protein [Deltaproteobacteria bacterium]|nr:MAG: TolC family protein [Deltaproteobacteria bacterium]
MKRTALTLTLALIALNAAIASDDTYLEGDLNSVIEYAQEHSPAIIAAKGEWLATLESYRVTTAYPDPEMMVTWFPEPIETRLGPQEWNATISQQIPYPGELESAGEIVEAKSDVAKAGFEKVARGVTTNVTKSLHELWYIRGAEEVVREQLKLVKHILLIATTTYGEGDSTLLELTKVKSQEAQLGYDLTLLEELEIAETATLNSLIGRDANLPIGETVIPPIPENLPPVEKLVDAAKEHRDEIAMARGAVAVADASFKKANLENRPDFKVGLFYAGIGEPDVPSPPPDAGRDAYGIQFGIKIPIWGSKRDGRVASATAKRDAASAQLDNVKNSTAAAVYSKYFNLLNSKRLVNLYSEELIPQGRAALENAENWLNNGEGSLGDLLEARAAYHNFQLSMLRARADFGKNRADMERLTGVSIAAAGGGENE